MHGIELLLANCDRLTSLTDMNYFEGVTPEEIEKLKAQYIYLDSDGNTDCGVFKRGIQN